jgi:hypothetical protein
MVIIKKLIMVPIITATIVELNESSPVTALNCSNKTHPKNVKINKKRKTNPK